MIHRPLQLVVARRAGRSAGGSSRHLGVAVGDPVVGGGRRADQRDRICRTACHRSATSCPHAAAELGLHRASCVKPAIESVQIAVWGTLLGVVLALPICFFAARNLSPHPAVYHVTRQVLNVMRGINEIILALIFVAADRARSVRRRAGARHPRRRHARQVLRRGDRGHRRGAARSVPVGRCRAASRPSCSACCRRSCRPGSATIFYRFETNMRHRPCSAWWVRAGSARRRAGILASFGARRK